VFALAVQLWYSRVTRPRRLWELEACCRYRSVLTLRCQCAANANGYTDIGSEGSSYCLILRAERTVEVRPVPGCPDRIDRRRPIKAEGLLNCFCIKDPQSAPMDAFLRVLVALIVSTTWVLATYIMDDTNTTIQYLPSLSSWHQVNCPDCYNQTK
jgi:hypothetical protein